MKYISISEINRGSKSGGFKEKRRIGGLLKVQKKKKEKEEEES